MYINTSQGSIELYIDFPPTENTNFHTTRLASLPLEQEHGKPTFHKSDLQGYIPRCVPIPPLPIVAVLVSCWIRRQRSITVHTIGNITVH